MTLLAVFVHECGHLLTARLLGVPLRGFRLTPLGALMGFDFSHVPYWKEAVVHLAGAAFGMGAAMLSRAVLGSRADTFLGISLCLSFVNLLPLEGLDGGGVLWALLSWHVDPAAVYRWSRAVSLLVLLLFWVAVVWIEMRIGTNLGLLLFAVGLMLGFHQ